MSNIEQDAKKVASGAKQGAKQVVADARADARGWLAKHPFEALSLGAIAAIVIIGALAAVLG